MKIKYLFAFSMAAALFQPRAAQAQSCENGTCETWAVYDSGSNAILGGSYYENFYGSVANVNVYIWDPNNNYTSLGGAVNDSYAEKDFSYTPQISGTYTIVGYNYYMLEDNPWAPDGYSSCTQAADPPQPPDPTPNIQGVTQTPWQAGSQISASVSGSGFGTSPTLQIQWPDGTYYNTSCSGPLCDGQIAFTATVPADAGGTATLVVTSNGYNGQGFFAGGSGDSPTSNEYQVVVQGSGTCGDQRDSIIAQYATYGATLYRPVCTDFTTNASSAHFSFNELKSPDADWAILRADLFDGLEATRSLEGGSSITINRGYSTPAHNYAISNGATPNSQHIYGTAADMGTGSAQATWDLLSAAAKAALACVEPESQSTISHVHADWRLA